MITPDDHNFLRRALRLAMNGRGYVEPNPMVGCVLVKNGQTIGEGWHDKFGGPHAEPNALADCRQRGNDPAGATAYVTLEPCCHENKKTPPCAPRLIEATVARVVIGCLDPNPDVNGKGVPMLQGAGIEVDVLPSSSSSRSTGFQPVASDSRPKTQVENVCYEGGLDGSHFRQLIAPFILREQGCYKAYLTLKWAETRDGKISGPGGRRLQITGDFANSLVHQLRGRSDAIAVGINTVLSDDPLLTSRVPNAARSPARYVLDSALRLPLDARLVQTARDVPLTVFARSLLASDEPAAAKAATLRARGVNVSFFVDADENGRLSTVELLGFSPLREHSHVLVEPGHTLAEELLPWAQRVWRFVSREAVGGADAIDATPVSADFVETGRLALGPDVLIEYLNASPFDPCFFAAVPSADFVLAAEAAGSPVA